MKGVYICWYLFLVFVLGLFDLGIGIFVPGFLREMCLHLLVFVLELFDPGIGIFVPCMEDALSKTSFTYM